MNEIKTVSYKGKLYRANKDIIKNGKLVYKAKTKKNILASVNYKNAPLKYFTLKRNNVKSYRKEGTTYTKNWNVTDELNLVDILDLKTREAIEAKLNQNKAFKNAIEKAFPINEGKVGRMSSSVEQDNIVLRGICELEYDGYYMESKNAFHSEIGLCKKAFNKLKLEKNPEHTYMPSKTLKRSRAEYEAQSSPVNVSPFQGALFGTLNKNNKMNMPNLPNIRENNNMNIKKMEPIAKRIRLTPIKQLNSGSSE
jgi:hypothetical protein